MASFIFSNERYIEAMLAQQATINAERADLYKRLGVRITDSDVVTILVISSDEFLGHDAVFELAMHCQKIYKKEVNLQKVRFIVLRNLEQAKCSPHLERASFIFIPDENLLDANLYPELETILPFH